MKGVSLLSAVFFSAIVILAFGILFPFIKLGVLDSKYDNTEYITAMFSLSGILFFCAALIYQIREYKLQVDELKKSVEAQTKSSDALEKQKLLLQEQTTNALIFNMIDSFNQFKDNELIQEAIRNSHDRSRHSFSSFFANMATNNMEKKSFNKDLAKGIKESFTETIKADPNIYFVKKFVQFAYNIFHLIDQKQVPNQQDWFRPFIYIHLSKEESIVLHLSNLVDYGMPVFNKMQWGHQLTLNLIEMINPMKERDQYKLLDAYILTEELNEVKQNAK